MPLRATGRRLAMLLMMGLLGGANARPQNAPALNLMPWPASVQNGSGVLKIDAPVGVAFTGYNEARLDQAGHRFLSQLHRQTGLLIAGKTAEPGKATVAVHTDNDSRQ